jgi:hypothetical protein
MNQPSEQALKAMREARQELTDIGPRLAEIARMTVDDLRVEFLRLYGFPTNSRNKDHLRKRIAWKIQADAEGGLSKRALQRIEELAPLAPVRWRPDLKNIQFPTPSSTAPPRPTPATSEPTDLASHPIACQTRDDRLPPPGTTITRTYRNREYRVRILADGFEYDGGFYDSLSRVARVITSTNWNGFLFFQRALEQAKQGKA